MQYTEGAVTPTYIDHRNALEFINSTQAPIVKDGSAWPQLKGPQRIVEILDPNAGGPSQAWGSITTSQKARESVTTTQGAA